MPPKPKYTAQQIIAAALDVVSRKGAQALTAKELGKALEMSTSPIFTVFDSMEQVRDGVKQAALARFEEYAHKTAGDMPIFKRVGMRMVLFAREEPKLFQLIFMSSDRQATSFDGIYAQLGSVAQECLDAIAQDYGLSASDARALFEHSWIHTFGIATLCATGVCDFSDQEISHMLTQDFTAMMALLRSGPEGKE